MQDRLGCSLNWAFLLVSVILLTSVAWTFPTPAHSITRSSALTDQLPSSPSKPPIDSPGPSLVRRENYALSLPGGWSFFCTTFTAVLPVEDASLQLQEIYLTFKAFATQFAIGNARAKDAISLTLSGLDLRFEPDQLVHMELPWMVVASFCKLMYRASQRGWAGKYQGVLMNTAGAVIYVSLMDAADRPMGSGGNAVGIGR